MSPLSEPVEADVRRKVLCGSGQRLESYLTDIVRKPAYWDRSGISLGCGYGYNPLTAVATAASIPGSGR